jgi:hypothetical protein
LPPPAALSRRSITAVTSIHSAARPSVILATLAAIAIALAVCATAATVIVASDVTRERERVQEHGAVASISVSEAREALSTMPSLRATIDSLTASLAPFAPADSLTIALMTVQWDSRPAQHRAVFAPSRLEVHPDAAPASSLSDLNDAVLALRGERALDSALLNPVLADTASAWLDVWRRFARSAPLPPLWGYRDGLPGVSSSFDLPIRGYTGVRHLQLLNEAAGRVALSRGDARTALLRAQENVAATRHYLDSPLLTDFAFGRSIAVQASRLIADAARALGDSATLALAASLAQLAANSSASFLALNRAAERDAASPSGTLAMELFDDDKLPFAVRVEILYACGHTREVLFGFAPEREQRLATLAAQHRDHPAFGPLLGLMPAAARQVRENPVSLLEPGVWPTAGALDGVLPDAVAARAVLCQQSF